MLWALRTSLPSTGTCSGRQGFGVSRRFSTSQGLSRLVSLVRVAPAWPDKSCLLNQWPCCKVQGDTRRTTQHMSEDCPEPALHGVVAHGSLISLLSNQVTRLIVSEIATDGSD